MVALNVGVKAAQAACSRKMRTYACHTWSTKGRTSAVPARTPSIVAIRVLRGTRSARALISGPYAPSVLERGRQSRAVRRPSVVAALAPMRS